MSFAILIGTLLGAVAAYAGGAVDNIIMRLMDVLMAFPSLLLAIAIVSVLGTGLINALLAIGIVSIPRFARLVRSTVLSVKELDYVQASRALGGSSMHILFRRILPNAITPLIVQELWALPPPSWMRQRFPSWGWVLNLRALNGV